MAADPLSAAAAMRKSRALLKAVGMDQSVRRVAEAANLSGRMAVALIYNKVDRLALV